MSKKKKLAIILIVAILVAVIVAVTLILVLNKNKKKIDPTIEVQVTSSVVYAGDKLESVALSLKENSTSGEVFWINPNEELKLGKNEYEWKFVPENQKKYNQVTGKIEVEANARSVEEISVLTNPSKLSGYVAYDELDTLGLTIKVVFDGEKEQVISDGFKIVYANGESLRLGDTSVLVKYGDKTCEITLTEAVVAKQIQTPRVSEEYFYTGNEQIVQFEESNWFTLVAGTNVATEVGNYQAEFELADKSNLVWEETNSNENLSVPFEIKNAKLEVIENNYVGDYDGKGHYASVESENANQIYYSLNELNAENYMEASTKPIEFTDAINEVVYYYIVANENYENMAGELIVTINKLSPQVSSRDVLAINSQQPINLNENFVSVIGLNDEVLSEVSLSFEYYTRYVSDSDNDKTTENVGATSLGGAPANSGTYYFVVKVAEQTNYNAITSSVYTLVIQNENYDLYPEKEDRTYSWISGDYYVSIAKTNQNGIIELMLVSNLFDSNVIYRLGETYAFSSDNKVYTLSFSPNMNILTITNSADLDDTYSFTKFQEPEFVGTYAKNTIGDENNLSKIEIYSSVGSIMFKFEYVYMERGSIKKSTVTGSVSYTNIEGGNDLTLSYTSSSRPYNFFAIYNSETKSLTISNFAFAGVNGEYLIVE